MRAIRFGRLAVLFGTTVLLAGCQQGGDTSLFGRKAEATGETQAPGAASEREVEAPDVFQATETGLWDGRPSLGGVWVAHPDVTDPERVMIRNTENGKSVVGALFRREREMPGPSFQVSSDAASALELLAGKPTELNVVALRKEKVPVAPPPMAISEEAPETAEAAANPEKPAKETRIEAAPLAAAAAAIEKADPAGSAKAAGSPRPRARATPPAPATPAPPAPRVPAMAPDDIAAPPPGTVTIPGAAPAPTPEVAAAPAPKPRASSLAKPYLQIGIFNVEDFAKETGEKLRKDGIVPTIRAQKKDGKDFWRVLVGPATTRTERSALLEKVKGLGYTDAYAVTN